MRNIYSYGELLHLVDSPSSAPVRQVEPINGGRVWSFCPTHADGSKYGRRSLSLHPDYGLTCFAGCPPREVAAALRQRAGVHPVHTPQRAGSSRSDAQRSPPLGQVVAAWVYCDAAVKPVFRVVRLNSPDGGKTFLQQHPTGNRPCCPNDCKPAAAGWRWGRGGAAYVLYNLPALVGADYSEFIFAVEGEACAEALIRLGLIATTAPEGAKARWRPEYTQALRRRRVVVLPDNDRPGAAHAEKVGAALLGRVAELRFVVLPALPYKGDVVDWLAAGGTRDALLALAERAPVVRPPSELFPKAVDTRVLDARGVAFA